MGQHPDSRTIRLQWDCLITKNLRLQQRKPDSPQYQSIATTQRLTLFDGQLAMIAVGLVMWLHCCAFALYIWECNFVTAVPRGVLALFPIQCGQREYSFTHGTVFPWGCKPNSVEIQLRPYFSAGSGTIHGRNWRVLRGLRVYKRFLLNRHKSLWDLRHLQSRIYRRHQMFPINNLPFTD